ncbi:MAG: hypothetical protein JOZ99_11990 [Actinobacteria bacterium]|nr:hypothetical protein [Actinomycetota bacterium]
MTTRDEERTVVVTSMPLADAPASPSTPASGRTLRITDRTLTLDDMLRFTASSAYTGIVRVNAGSSGDVAVDAGWIVAASLTGGVELDDLLSRRAGADRATEVVAAAVLEHVVDVLLELELAGTGTTTLELAGGVASPLADGIRLEVDAVLESKRQRLREWKQIAARMPAPTSMLSRASNLPPGALTVDGDDWRVLCVLREDATVAHVVRAVGTGAFCACRSVLRLVDAGAVEVSAAEVGAVDVSADAP